MAMDNIETTKNSPAGTDNISAADDEIRTLKQDIVASFPGMTGNGTDAVVTDAGSGGSPTGPEIAFASNTLDSNQKAVWDQGATDAANALIAANTNSGRLDDIEAQQVPYGGVVTGVGSGTLTVTGPSGWTAADNGTGRVIVTTAWARPCMSPGPP